MHGTGKRRNSMKRKLIIVGLAALMGIMSGCAKKASEEKAGQVETGGLVSIDTGDDEGENTQAGGNAEEQYGPQIEEQTFDVTLDGWGNVTFAAFMPKESKDGDVSFKLMRNGETAFDLPGITEDNRRIEQHFIKVAAVSFKDYNGDGKKDIIIINEYARQSQPEQRYHEVRLYTQAGTGREFSLEQGLLTEYLMKNDYSDTIQLVMEGIAEYQAYQKAETEAKAGDAAQQVQLMADNAAQWADTMADEGVLYFYAVTDLDHNGRLELIISSCQGTGIYTYSYYYEVNKNFDGLNVFEPSMPEGDSQADIITDSVPVYYDAQKNLYYYIFDDTIRGGADMSYTYKRALFMTGGKVDEMGLGCRGTVFDGQAVSVTYTDADDKEISEDEYLKLADTRFSGLEKKTASIDWHKADKSELLSMGRGQLVEKLLESYKGFGSEK